MPPPASQTIAISSCRQTIAFSKFQSCLRQVYVVHHAPDWSYDVHLAPDRSYVIYRASDWINDVNQTPAVNHDVAHRVLAARIPLHTSVSSQ